jgi:putative ABC transport system ATP-binding protein
MSVTDGYSGIGEEAPVLVVEDLQQRLRDPKSGEQFVVTLEGRLEIHSGTFTAILGPSGCGKTTLLSVLGLLRRPSEPKSIGCFQIAAKDPKGDVAVHDLKDLWHRNRQHSIDKLRRQHIGFALQSGELLSSLTVRENIAIPLCLNCLSRSDVRDRVDELLEAFGLNASGHISESALYSTGSENESDRSLTGSRLANARVNKLSGGEYQRVVLARAIAHRPRLAFVDEPTSSLNRELARVSLSQLKHSQTAGNDPGAVMMITHDEQLAAEFADTIIRMAPEPGRAAGRVVEIITTPGNSQTSSPAETSSSKGEA